jgi:hypothetical protein
LWGLGRGVYPKAEAPVPPFHEGCLCVLAPRFGIHDKAPKQRRTLTSVLLENFVPTLAEQIKDQMQKNPVKKAKDC